MEGEAVGNGVVSAFGVDQNMIFAGDLHDDKNCSPGVLDDPSHIFDRQTVIGDVKDTRIGRAVIAAQKTVAADRGGRIIISGGVEQETLLVILNGSTPFDNVGFFVGVAPVVDDQIFSFRKFVPDKKVVAAFINGDEFFGRKQYCAAEKGRKKKDSFHFDSSFDVSA